MVWNSLKLAVASMVRLGQMATRSLENIGRSVEELPGANYAASFLDEVAEGAAFGVALVWALRWWFALAAVAFVAVNLD